MIIEEEKASPLPSPSNMEDLPPAYHDLIHSADALVDPPSLKAPFSHLPPVPSGSGSAIPNEPPAKSPAPKASSPGLWGWWYASQFAPEQQHIQQTIRNLLMSLITTNLSSTSSSAAALGLLESCRKACERYSVPFSSALQDMFIEGHSVVYWTIVKRPSSADVDNDPLLEAMISYAQPLVGPSLTEFRVACLVSSDHRTFRRYLYPLTIPDADRLLLDLRPGGPFPDQVVVEEIEGNEEEFVVKMALDEFRRRMGVRGKLSVEFIAKGRLFRLAFSSSPAPSLKGKQNEDAWSISLSIHEGSSSTWIDSRLVIPDAVFASRPSQSPISIEKSREKPAISLRLKTSNEPLRSAPLHLDDLSKLSRSAMRREMRVREREAEIENKVVVGLGSSLMGAGLMYPGSSYIASDGKLRAVLEARLRKPETECIIC